MTSRSRFPEGVHLGRPVGEGTLGGGDLGMLRPKGGGHTYFAIVHLKFHPYLYLYKLH